MKRTAAPELPAFIESMLPRGIERYRVPVFDQQMHVMEIGDGRPVVMLHGNPTWGFLYRFVASALLDEPLRLIMPDLIGLGFSTKPRDIMAHRLDNHSRYLGALIDALDLHDLVFVGQDWGGAIGVHALTSRAHRLAGLVMLNTAVTPPKPGFRPTAFHRFSQLPVVSDLAFRVGEFPQNMLRKVQGQPASITARVTRAYRYPLRHRDERQAPLGLARMVPDGLEHPSVPAMAACQRFLEQFQGPAAIVWGDRDPILGRLCRRVSRLLPTATVTRTQAGHFLQEEVPDVIADAIRSVAARCKPVSRPIQA